MQRNKLRVVGRGQDHVQHTLVHVCVASLCRHEIVNVALAEKPNWFLKKNPKGTTPAVEIDGKVRGAACLSLVNLSAFGEDKSNLKKVENKGMELKLLLNECLFSSQIRRCTIRSWQATFWMICHQRIHCTQRTRTEKPETDCEWRSTAAK